MLGFLQTVRRLGRFDDGRRGRRLETDGSLRFVDFLGRLNLANVSLETIFRGLEVGNAHL
jgi:hypothetical protein